MPQPKVKRHGRVLQILDQTLVGFEQHILNDVARIHPASQDRVEPHVNDLSQLATTFYAIGSTPRERQGARASRLRAVLPPTTSQGLEVLAQVGHLVRSEPQATLAVVCANHVDQGRRRPSVCWSAIAPKWPSGRDPDSATRQPPKGGFTLVPFLGAGAVAPSEKADPASGKR